MIPDNIMTFWWFLFGDQPGLTFEGVVDVTPNVPGLEWTSPENRMHWGVPANRMHFTPPENRMHYTMPEED
jgi:hypothetical protein